MKLLKKDQFKTVAVIALMIGCYVVFVYMPAQRQRTALRDQVNEAQAKVASAPSVDLEALSREAMTAEQRFADEFRAMPRERQVFVVMDGIAGALLDESLADHRLSQSDPKHFAHYAVQPIDLEFEGGFADAFAALRSIETLPYPVRIERVEMDSSQDDGSGNVIAAVQLSAFFEEGARHE